MTQINIQREYKDTLFRILFKEKQELLSLYNAINDSNYQDSEALQINVLEDVLYMGMKNDVSFLIDHHMNLYEHQSSWNPNMPLRDFWYMANLYKGYVEQNRLDVYGSTQLRLPRPKCIVFYNGTKKIDDRVTVRLSEMFDIPEDQEADLECVVTYLNINYGHNQKLMAQCQKLKEYSILIDQIRQQLSQGKQLKAAVDQAVKYCIQNHILESFLRKHRAEVCDMNWWDYDEELHMRNEKQISYEEGLLAGRAEAENARIDAENARTEAENARIDAENARTEAENARIDAENARTEADLLRKELAHIKQNTGV